MSNFSPEDTRDRIRVASEITLCLPDLCVIASCLIVSVFCVLLRTCLSFCVLSVRNAGGTVVKALCYKSEGRWFDPSL